MSEQKQQFNTRLAKINNTYAPMIERQLTGNGIDMDDYSKQCVVNAITSINQALDQKGIDWTDPQLDQNNLTEILLNVASLKLNAAASPREVYFQTRNVKVKGVDGNGNSIDVWKKQIEMGIEGDGNDAILSRFGRNVDRVSQIWLVREEDEFTYPTFTGLEMQPPKWTPTGKGKVIRVVYPIIKTDQTVEYHISEREDVIRNLIAHINNNLMNETFGIAESRFKATAKQKKEIAAKKSEVLNKVKDMSLDEALDDPETQKHISPAWKDPQSRESMIIRKMRNNVAKKIPKDFSNSFVSMQYEKTTDETYKQVKQEIEDNANQEFIDVEPIEGEEHSQTTEPELEEKEPEPEPQSEPQQESKRQKEYDLFEQSQEQKTDDGNPF
ncbi:hypothetical protein HXA31_19940 [Salipaludibacillus agaradhaerens]|uniref:hypothetical protein n=1 Tax=Salipaludibacillus TaxID=1884449 RepID=UPI0020D0F3F3|nr:MULTISPECIES: hypothetical protein [Salipaludibacillus]MCR6116602.1 hypothetical protein [Salipaludibacillus agaradhaerens]UTR13460.1 hypothetical protein MM221_12565 [Salipaludibacillus sp. LMS25]